MHEHALLAIMALLLNAAVAGPRQWYMALGIASLGRLPGQFVRTIERKLNRDHRSLKEREMRGTLLVVAVVLVSALIGWLLGLFFTHNLHFMELVLVTICLPVRPSWDIASQISKAIRMGDVARARTALAGTKWRHHALLEEHGLCRAGIEILAVNFSTKIIAPVFWYMLLGLPGLLMCKLSGLLQESLSQPGQTEEGFAKAALGFHQLVQFVPARIASLLWLVASPFLPAANWNEAIAIITKEISANPERLAVTTVAAALRLSLGGPSSLYTSGQWIGTGTVKAVSGDIKRALYLFTLIHLLLFIILWFFL